MVGHPVGCGSGRWEGCAEAEGGDVGSGVGGRDGRGVVDGAGEGGWEGKGVGRREAVGWSVGWVVGGASLLRKSVVQAPPRLLPWLRPKPGRPTVSSSSPSPSMSPRHVTEDPK